MDLLLSSFRSDTKQKGEPEGSPLMHIYGNA